MRTTNVFANFDAANYDTARPYFHPSVYERLRLVLPDPRPHLALDVACGTGHLLTVGLAIHWFDQSAFFREAHRVLRSAGWLVVFDAGFCEEMSGEPSFLSWLEEYRSRFPSPPLARGTLNERLVDEAAFRHFHSEPIVHVAAYTLEGLAAYARSQSGVIDALLSERAEEGEVTAWLRNTLRPFFRKDTAICKLRGRLWIFRATADSHHIGGRRR